MNALDSMSQIINAGLLANKGKAVDSVDIQIMTRTFNQQTYSAAFPKMQTWLNNISQSDEFEYIEAINNRTKHTADIALLTAKGEDSDKVLGLTVGADDYITKPFNPIEVSARVKSQLRRYMQLGGGSVRPDVIRVGGIELDDKEKRVTLDGEPVALTPTEYDILKLLMQNPGQVFSPREIYSKIWNDLPLGSENTVAVHIRHLREKLEINPAEPRYLKVVWGQGYKCEKQG